MRLAAAPRVAIVVGAVVFGAFAVSDRWEDVRPALGQLSVATLITALVAAVLASGASALLWRALLAGLGSALPVGPAARVFLVAQLGKYIPGSVWPVVAQMELGRTYGVPRRRSATASVLAMLVTLTAGLFVAAATLPLLASEATARFRWALAVAPLLLLVLHPRLINPMVDRLLRLVRRPPLEHPLTLATVAAAFGWALATWAAYGLHAWLIAVDVGAAPTRTLALALGGFALSWCAGFLVVVAPAGAGVRDVALVAAFSPVLGPGEAIVVALASRLVTTVGDLLAAGGAGLSAAVVLRTPGAKG